MLLRLRRGNKQQSGKYQSKKFFHFNFSSFSRHRCAETKLFKFIRRLIDKNGKPKVAPMFFACLPNKQLIVNKIPTRRIWNVN